MVEISGYGIADANLKFEILNWKYYMSKLKAVLVASSLVIGAQLQAVPVIQNTGGVVGGFDANYQLIDSTGANLAGYSSQIPNIGDTSPGRGPLSDYWVGSSGQWISPYTANPYVSQYYPGYEYNAWVSDSPSNVETVFNFKTVVGGTGSGDITLLIASDNPTSIFVGLANFAAQANAVLVSSGEFAYKSFATVTLHVTAGDVLVFRVTNQANAAYPFGNPAGLLVKNANNSVPDGGLTAALLSLGMAGVGMVRRYIK